MNHSKKKLERFIGLRERIEQSRRVELADAKRAVDAAETHRREREDQHAQAVANLIGANDASGDDLIHMATLVTAERSYLARATQIVQEKTVIADERKDALVEASRDVKVLEILHKTASKTALAREDKIEQDEFDELALRAGAGGRP